MHAHSVFANLPIFIHFILFVGVVVGAETDSSSILAGPWGSKMGNFVYNVVNISILCYTVLYGVTVENGNNYYHGIGVSAFSSRCSSVQSSSRFNSETILAASNRIRITDSGSAPFSFALYTKDPSGSNQQELKSTFVETTTAKGDNNTDEQSSILSVTDFAGPFALLLTSQFLLFIGVGAVIPSIPLYGKEIGLSGAANGIVISTPAVALFLAANWSGRRADIARKPAMMIGMAIIAVSDIGTALAQGIYTLIFARLGLGAGRALSEAGERGMLVDLANQMPELRGRALAAQQAVVALGIAIGAPAGGVVIEQYGPRAAFLCVSVAATIALVLYSFLPETIVQSPSSSTVASNSTEMLNENTSGAKVWIELLNRNEWKGLTLCQSGSSFGFAAKIASIPILASNILPGGAVGTGALLSAAGLSGLVGAPIGGYFTDQFGSKGAAVISGIISSLGLILIPVALRITEDSSLYPSIHVSIAGVLLQTKALFFSLAVLLWSLGVSAQAPALTALAQEKSPPGVEATSLSLTKAAGDGTYIIAPFILGLVADALKEYPGIECALAGSATLLGTMALAILLQQDDSLK